MNFAGRKEKFVEGKGLINVCRYLGISIVQYLRKDYT